MKSASDSKPRQAKKAWRLKKTLSRKLDVRPIEADDIKFIWAAYKRGALQEMFEGTDLDAPSFKQEFETAVILHYSGAWVISAETKQGFTPIGIAFGSWHPMSPDLMVIVGMAWFPWASKRNVIEGTVHFFNQVRRDVSMVGYVRPKYKRLYEVVLKHGIMRRIGTSHVMFNDEPATVYETRAA